LTEGIQCSFGAAHVVCVNCNELADTYDICFSSSAQTIQISDEKRGGEDHNFKPAICLQFELNMGLEF